MFRLQSYHSVSKKLNTLWCTFFFLLFFIPTNCSFGQVETHIRKKFEIIDGIAPKSVVSSGNGLFAAQNMMYRHTVTIYNESGERVSKINDAVELAGFGINKYGSEKFRGAPVEGVFSAGGSYLWVSNYHMSGSTFTNPGCDDCVGTDYDPSFIYKINTETFVIEHVIEVGSVPKFMAISSNEKWLLVSNWVSSDVSIINLATEREVKRITVGAHPRGIAITEDEKYAYITIMGSTKLVEIDLETYATRTIEKIGKSPRSVLLSQHDSILYISLNGSHELVKYNRYTNQRTTCKTAAGPRSMTLSPDEKSLYVVNYFDNLFTKINTDSMRIEAEIATADKPIGICGNWKESEIWVACYSGKIEVFKDFKLERTLHPPTLFGWYWKQSIISNNDSVPLSKFERHNDIALNKLMISDERKYEHHFRPKNKIKSLPFMTTNIDSFHLIVGAFSKLNNALEKRNLIIKENENARVITGNKYTYVSIGSFATKEKAEEAKVKFIAAHPSENSAWILSR